MIVSNPRPVSVSSLQESQQCKYGVNINVFSGVPMQSSEYGEILKLDPNVSICGDFVDMRGQGYMESSRLLFLIHQAIKETGQE